MSPGIIVDRRGPRGTCKICHHALRPQDATVWVTKPSIGLAHETCTNQEDPHQPCSSSDGSSGPPSP